MISPSHPDIDSPDRPARVDANVNPRLVKTHAPLAFAALLLSACGGGGGDSGGTTAATTPASPHPADVGAPVVDSRPPAPPNPQTVAGASTTKFTSPANQTDVARLFSQATLGANRDQINAFGTSTYDTWLTSQFSQPLTQSHCSWMTANGYTSVANLFDGLDNSLWRKLISSPDTLRQRIVLALSEIFVVSANGITGYSPQLVVGHFVDLLEANAFGNFRTLLNDITLSPAMGTYLTYKGNVKSDVANGNRPDENYARESMQLFTVGLYLLNPDGTPVLVNGAPVETYGPDDVTGLARVFTGWDLDTSNFPIDDPRVYQIPMVPRQKDFETGSKTFLGSTIEAGVQSAASCAACLSQALDILFNHPNTAPFFSRQLIQRLVTSNPSPAYVSRVAAAFRDNGAGVRGDMKAVIRQVLLDDEARSPLVSVAPGFGKLREPMVRFLNWARGFNVTSASNVWGVGDLSDTVTGIGQSPMRAPSVFNFFRPGYIPPQTAMGANGLVGAEFQITNESSLASYVNFMRRAVAGSGIDDVLPDYSSLMPIVADSSALLAELNTVIAAGQISTSNLALMKAALDTIPVTTPAGIRFRINASLVLIMSSPQYIVQK